MEERFIMQWMFNVGLLIGCYLIGSIPFGLIFVKLSTGKIFAM
jgi:glycerol-3-phosphate acyltransferase PlsY